MDKFREFIEKRRVQLIIMTLCFIFAAIFLLLALSQIYSFIFQEKTQPNNQPILTPNQSNLTKLSSNNTNQTQKQPPQPQNNPPKDDFFRGMPRGSPMMLIISIFAAILFILAGLAIYWNGHSKEEKELKTKAISQVLLPDEKSIIEIIQKNNGEMAQSELVRKSGFNKLKISRIIRKLESSGILEKHPYGMTNHIKIK